MSEQPHPLPDTGRPDRPDLANADKIIEIASETLSALCHARWAGGEAWERAWTWHIPVDEERDTDCRLDAVIGLAKDAVAYARRLEAEVAALRGVVKDGFAEGFNAGVGIGEDWTRPNAKRAREEAWENSDAREAATPGEEGWKE